MLSTKVNRRKNFRHHIYAPLEYALSAETSSGIFEGLTFNISVDGLCLYLDNPLSEGDEISIKSNALPFSCDKATVRWVKTISKELHMAGLRIVSNGKQKNIDLP